MKTFLCTLTACLAVTAASFGATLNLSNVSTGITISSEPVATMASPSDDLLINSTNMGAGTWTTHRATVGTVAAGMAPVILAGTTNAWRQDATNAAAAAVAAANIGGGGGAVATNMTVWVATTGSDANAGTTNAPFLTPSNAVAKVAPGGTVWFSSGTYNLNYSLHLSNVTFMAAGATFNSIANEGFSGLFSVRGDFTMYGGRVLSALPYSSVPVVIDASSPTYKKAKFVGTEVYGEGDAFVSTGTYDSDTGLTTPGTGCYLEAMGCHIHCNGADILVFTIGDPSTRLCFNECQFNTVTFLSLSAGFAEFNGCAIDGVPGGAVGTRITLSGVLNPTVVFNACSITVSNNVTGVTGKIDADLGPSGHIIYNGSYDGMSTNIYPHAELGLALNLIHTTSFYITPRAWNASLGGFYNPSVWNYDNGFAVYTNTLYSLVVDGNATLGNTIDVTNGAGAIVAYSDDSGPFFPGGNLSIQLYTNGVASDSYLATATNVLTTTGLNLDGPLYFNKVRGVTTNVATSGRTLLITNGVIMGVQ